MAISLVNGVTDIFKSQGLGPFAAQSGESETSVLRGFETSIAAMVSGLASKIGQGGSRQIFDLVNSPANDTRVLDNVRSAFPTSDRPSDGPGSRMLSMLFGGRQSAIADAVSRESGIRASSAASLMTMGAPLLLGWLGKRVHDDHMDPARLSSLLSQEANTVQGSLPTGVASLLGTGTDTRQTYDTRQQSYGTDTRQAYATDTRQSYGAVPPVAQGVVRERRRNPWLWPLLAALLILGPLLAWFARRPHAVPTTYSRPDYSSEVKNSVQQATNSVQQATQQATQFVQRHLPNNVDLHIPPGRMEDHLLGFIQDPSKQVDNTTWFDFDRLTFDTNAATLQASSQEQLRNVAEILKAYPNAHVRIGGYTDNTGNAAENLQLSQQRAENVRQNLINMGISGDRLEAQGYGSEHPVGDNSTEEGRQKNRRISLLVTQK